MTDRDGTSPVCTTCYTQPIKRILQPRDIEGLWKKSEAYNKLSTFIGCLNTAAKGTPLSAVAPPSPAVQRVLSMLDTLRDWIDKFPPQQQPMRYGNKAFKIWAECLQENAATLVQDLLPIGCKGSANEVAVYLTESFGNPTRIDYGTGHEVNFVAFLCCLSLLGVFEETDAQALSLTVMKRYMTVVRALLVAYVLEPAGSHGVWGLDDYHFMPFYLGSSQLVGNTSLTPLDIPNQSVCDKYADEYLFMMALNYIYTGKKGLFAEHSPMLWNISGVAKWEKVNTGLLRLYHDEVLAKFPVIQHFKFGSLLSADPIRS